MSVMPSLMPKVNYRLLVFGGCWLNVHMASLSF